MYETEYTGQNRIIDFMYGVYGLMSGALAVTAITAYYVSTIPNISTTLFASPMLMTLIFVGQIALVIGLSAMIQKLTFPMALSMFMVYAISVGVTTSLIFKIYTFGSIVQTFAVAAGMFGVTSIFGYLTGADLSKLGNVMMMALWGIIIALVVNLWLQNPMIDLLLSAVGVVVFTALTAYDTQKIKQMGQHMMGSGQMASKVAVLGALTLYLDFINLFLFLLRFMGRRRD
jgi:uncharacterized protein